MGAIFILLAVGALIGTWNMAGTIPTIVDYGLRLLNPNWFYPLIVVICAVTGAVTGSSWTTAGTLGVAFVGIAQVMGLSPEITAGAVISGSLLRRQDVAALRDDHPGAESGRWRDDCPAHSQHDMDDRSRYRALAC